MLIMVCRDKGWFSIWRRGFLVLAVVILLHSSCDSPVINAHCGDTDAQMKLGTGALFAGNVTDAVKWFERAAKGGDVHGMRMACWLRYDSTSDGIRNPKLARMWCNKASENGDPFGSYLLAKLHLDSEKENSKQLALSLLSVASLSGHPGVTSGIPLLEEKFCDEGPNTAECVEFRNILDSIRSAKESAPLIRY